MRAATTVMLSLFCYVNAGCRSGPAADQNTASMEVRKDLRTMRLEARAKFVPIITESRNLFGEEQEAARSRFATFKQANPDLFTFEVAGSSVEHIDVWMLDGEETHNQVFIWAWLGKMGAIGFSDGHVEFTENRALFDQVVSAGRGALRSHTMTSFEHGRKRTEHIPAGPVR